MPVGEPLAYPGGVREDGDQLQTIGVIYGCGGLKIIHRAKHAYVLKKAGGTTWAGVGQTAYDPTSYILVERETWIMLDEIEPGRKWKPAVRELREMADKHRKGMCALKKKTKKPSMHWPEEPLDRTGVEDLSPRSKSIAARTARELVPTKLNTISVTVTRTSDGKRDYVQIISDDMFAVNVVLIADKIKLKDER